VVGAATPHVSFPLHKVRIEQLTLFILRVTSITKTTNEMQLYRLIYYS